MPTASWLPREYLVHPTRTSRSPASDDQMGEWRFYLKDIVDVMKQRFAIITGGRSLDGCPVITFPDSGPLVDIADDDYRRLMVYLTDLPSLQEVDHGFVVVVDRRREKWNDVKTIIAKLSSFFPGQISMVLIMRPSSFLQKALSEVSNKFFKEVQFKVVVCCTLEELHEHVHPSQLTPDLGGSLVYEHEEWIEQRMAVEKFSTDLHSTSLNLQHVTERFQEAELPNDVESLENLIEAEEGEYTALRDELCSAARHGETLLGRIRRPSAEGASLELYPDNLMNVTAVERLLIQLDETEKGFAFFWLEHKKYLSRCLKVRKFELSFKEQQAEMTVNKQKLLEIPSSGNSVSQVQQIIEELEDFRRNTEGNVRQAEQLIKEGRDLESKNSCGLDSVVPKCDELELMVRDFNEQWDSKFELLQSYKNLHEKLEKADTWCNNGMELLATVQMEKCSFCAELAQSTLQSVEEFLETADNFCVTDPDEFYLIMKNIDSPETEALVKQVLKRIEDVQIYYKEKMAMLKKLASRLTRPVQAVTAVPCQQLSPTENMGEEDQPPETPKRVDRNSLNCTQLIIPEEAQLQIKHIMAELQETEESYISQLSSIIQGYIKNMSDPAMKDFVPVNLTGKADILFGNIEDIYKFHQEDFLNSLRKSQGDLEQTGSCFIDRAETFHKLYSIYSMNKPKSEALIRQCGKDNPFFKECQKRLDHKLDLDAYLLIPVQRITKYQLLIRDLLKQSGHPQLQEAMNIMLEVVKYINDCMHQTTIIGFQGDIAECGKLLLQETFYVWVKKKEQILLPKRQQRHIFLYENKILITKRLEKKDGVYYEVRKIINNSVIGLTETFQEKDPSKFELRLHGGGEDDALILQARNRAVKATWVKEIRRILSQQFEQIKGEKTRRYSGIETVAETNVTLQISLPLKRPQSRQYSKDIPVDDMNIQNEAESSQRHGHPHIHSLHNDEWTIDFSHSDEENEADHPTEVHGKYIAHWDYNAVAEEEASLQKGQFVTVEKGDNAGWRFVRILNTGAKGWVPAAYLRPCSTDSSSTGS